MSGIKFYPYFTLTVHLVISVLDVNDKEPVFVDGGHYTANIRENMPPETFIKFDKVNGVAVQDKDADVRMYH